MTGINIPLQLTDNSIITSSSILKDHSFGLLAISRTETGTVKESNAWYQKARKCSAKDEGQGSSHWPNV